MTNKSKKNIMVWIVGLLSVFALIGLILIQAGQKNQPKINSSNQSGFPTTPQSSPTPKHADYKAAFAIYTNNTFRIFTASMYHNLSPDVYIEAQNPNIINVKKNDITWEDFFKTLPLSLTKSCLTTGTKETFCNSGNQTLKFYLNGIKTDNLLDQSIKEADKALISFGPENDQQIEFQLRELNKTY